MKLNWISNPTHDIVSCKAVSNTGKRKLRTFQSNIGRVGEGVKAGWSNTKGPPTQLHELKFAELFPRSAASPSATYARREAGTSAIFYFFLALMNFPTSVTCWCR